MKVVLHALTASIVETASLGVPLDGFHEGGTHRGRGTCLWFAHLLNPGTTPGVVDNCVHPRLTGEHDHLTHVRTLFSR